jgi:hypothetical protein
MSTANLFNFVYLMMLLGAQAAPAPAADDQAACAALMERPDVTVTYAVIKPAQPPHRGIAMCKGTFRAAFDFTCSFQCGRLGMESS